MLMTEIIADNVKRLMNHNGDIKQAELARRSGISQRTISNVLRPGSVVSITTETIELLAKFFKLEPYHLVIPNLPIDELLDRRIETVINCYAKSTPSGRENIQRVAENEVRYSSMQESQADQNKSS